MFKTLFNIRDLERYLIDFGTLNENYQRQQIQNLIMPFANQGIIQMKHDFFFPRKHYHQSISVNVGNFTCVHRIDPAASQNVGDYSNMSIPGNAKSLQGVKFDYSFQE